MTQTNDPNQPASNDKQDSNPAGTTTGSAASKPNPVQSNKQEDDAGKGGSNEKTFITKWTPIVIAFLAAAFTLWQAEIARNTAHRQLRAYLDVELAGWGKQLNKHTLKMFYAFKIVNFGQTPAKEVRVRGEIKFLPIQIPRAFVPEYRPLQNPEQYGLSFPHEDVAVTGMVFSDSTTHTEIENVETVESNLRAYAFISVTYKDIFGDEDNTSLCEMLQPGSIKRDSTGRIISGKWGPVKAYSKFQ